MLCSSWPKRAQTSISSHCVPGLLERHYAIFLHVYLPKKLQTQKLLMRVMHLFIAYSRQSHIYSRFFLCFLCCMLKNSSVWCDIISLHWVFISNFSFPAVNSLQLMYDEFDDLWYRVIILKGTVRPK